jgi:hypothetical protein
MQFADGDSLHVHIVTHFLPAAHFADDAPIGAMSNGGTKQITDRDGGRVRLFPLCLQANYIDMLDLELRRLFDDDAFWPRA